jgi:hypothetical protein
MKRLLLFKAEMMWVMFYNRGEGGVPHANHVLRWGTFRLYFCSVGSTSRWGRLDT